MTEYDKLWNYNDPAATENLFKEALKKLQFDVTADIHLQLLTQIARAQGLQQKFDDAHKTLDEVAPHLTEEHSIAHIRYFLERGRVFNTAANKRNAEVCFHSALDIAQKVGEDVYAIDAIHMLAIIANPADSIALNEEAILLAESSTEPNAKKWLGSLFNNLGWTFFDLAQYEKALSIFLRALQWREEQQTIPAIFLAKWCIARTLRALNKVNEAVTIQLALLEEMVEQDQKDGYVFEELAELYLLKKEEVYKMYFNLAHTELSQDRWLADKEPQRIARLLELSK